MESINKVAVLGTGVMGGQIAAHISNVGINVYAYDMTQEIAEAGVRRSIEIKPNAFYNKKNADLVRPVNYEADLALLRDCDWVIEAISENLEWKRELYRKIDAYLGKDTILTSNTSGILLSELTSDASESISSKLFITHFFNPPRYMRLVELITSDKNKGSDVKKIVTFIEGSLGKGVVRANDTPNFIANRIGVYGMMQAIRLTEDKNLSVEDVDALTGTIIGRPKSATYRTADIVGIDILASVASTAYEKCTDDPEREIFKLPEFVVKMIDGGMIGQKSGEGFYKKIDKGIIHSIDFKRLEYSPLKKTFFSAISLAKEHTSIDKRLRAIVSSSDNAGNFLWELTSRTVLYASSMIGEATESIISIDRAMRWGFGWDMGPFQAWDAIGFEYMYDRILSDGKNMPEWLRLMYDSGYRNFYSNDGFSCYCPDDNKYVDIDVSSKELSFKRIRTSRGTVTPHWSASIVDLGDGVAGIELHSVLKPDLNPIDGSVIEMVHEAIDTVDSQGYKALVISGDNKNFSAGANLNIILRAAFYKDWESIELFTNQMQTILQGLRFAPFPVIAAPYGLVLGGGFELIGACDRIVACSESYIGLVEVGVGLIPGAGGNLRMLSNISKKINTMMPGAFPIVQKAFETVGFAKVATSADHAKGYGYLVEEDIIITNRKHLLYHAKEAALAMSDGYTPPEVENFKLPGKSGRLVIEQSIKGFLKSKKISDHDALIARKLGHVLTGGDKGGPFSPVDEQYLLDIEREAFISLCGEQKSIERIQYMLNKGKPLRN